MSIYVASSWRNMFQPAVVGALRSAARQGYPELEPYDFRHPAPGDDGFRWSEVGLKQTCRCDHSRSYSAHGFCAAHGEVRYPDGACNCPTSDDCAVDDYLAALEHPTAVAGYANDFAAMEAADTFILVLPCGRSAHLELGWAVGAGKRTAILLEDPCTPELMYKMVDYLAPSLFDLLDWLGVSDEAVL